MPCVFFVDFFRVVTTHLGEVLSQAGARAEGEGVVGVVRPEEKADERHPHLLHAIFLSWEGKSDTYLGASGWNLSGSNVSGSLKNFSILPVT